MTCCSFSSNNDNLIFWFCRRFRFNLQKHVVLYSTMDSTTCNQTPQIYFFAQTVDLTI